MKRIILALLIAVSISGALSAGNIAFDFYKESFESGTVEKTGGFLYMKMGNAGGENVFYFHITFPVNQIIEFTKKETQIYYPDEKKAIIMGNKEAVSAGNFMDPAAKKLDLKALGFKLKELKKSKSGVKEVWVPSNITGSPFKSVTMEKDSEDKLMKMEMKAKNGSVMTRLEYANYVKIGEKKMPLYIKTYAGGDKQSYQEIISLSAVKDNAKLPDIIQNFKIPEGASVQRVQF